MTKGKAKGPEPPSSKARQDSVEVRDIAGPADELSREKNPDARWVAGLTPAPDSSSPPASPGAAAAAAERKKKAAPSATTDPVELAKLGVFAESDDDATDDNVRLSSRLPWLATAALTCFVAALIATNGGKSFATLTTKLLDAAQDAAGLDGREAAAAEVAETGPFALDILFDTGAVQPTLLHTVAEGWRKSVFCAFPPSQAALRKCREVGLPLSLPALAAPFTRLGESGAAAERKRQRGRKSAKAGKGLKGRGKAESAADPAAAAGWAAYIYLLFTCGVALAAVEVGLRVQFCSGSLLGYVAIGVAAVGPVMALGDAIMAYIDAVAYELAPHVALCGTALLAPLLAFPVAFAVIDRVPHRSTVALHLRRRGPHEQPLSAAQKAERLAARARRVVDCGPLRFGARVPWRTALSLICPSAAVVAAFMRCEAAGQMVLGVEPNGGAAVVAAGMALTLMVVAVGLQQQRRFMCVSAAVENVQRQAAEDAEIREERERLKQKRQEKEAKEKGE